MLGGKRDPATRFASPPAYDGDAFAVLRSSWARYFGLVARLLADF
jgi:hypothetical protein